MKEKDIFKGIEYGDIEILSKMYGDAFYLFDSNRFENNYKEILNLFRKHYNQFNIAYSCKTNYLPKCIELVNSNGGYAEVVSEMELEIARRSGVKHTNIIWNGPVKEPLALEKFLVAGGLCNIDNYEEWKYIKKIAFDNPNNILRIGIRCCFDTGDGVISRFGIDTQGVEFDQILSEVNCIDNIKLVSLQCHFAKRFSKYWKKRTLNMLSVYNYVKEKYGIVAEIIDLGGGITGNMTNEFAEQIHSEDVSPEKYAENSAKLVADFFMNKKEKPILLIEPGTGICADTMFGVFCIKNIKNNCRKWIATVNGSQKNIGMQGINPPIKIIHMGNILKYYEEIDIAGYTCIESDYLYKDYKGEMAIGDYVLLGYCGSYSLVSKPPFIQPNIPVLDIGKGSDKAVLLKREETVDDILITYLM